MLGEAGKQANRHSIAEVHPLEPQFLHLRQDPPCKFRSPFRTDLVGQAAGPGPVGHDCLETVWDPAIHKHLCDVRYVGQRRAKSDFDDVEAGGVAQVSEENGLADVVIVSIRDDSMSPRADRRIFIADQIRKVFAGDRPSLGSLPVTGKHGLEKFFLPIL